MDVHRISPLSMVVVHSDAVHYKAKKEILVKVSVGRPAEVKIECASDSIDRTGNAAATLEQAGKAS